MRDLDQDARTVAGGHLRPGRSPVGEPLQDGQALLDDPVALAAVQVGDHADAAGVVLVGRVVEPAGGGRRQSVHSRPFSFRAGARRRRRRRLAGGAGRTYRPETCRPGRRWPWSSPETLHRRPSGSGASGRGPDPDRARRARRRLAAHRIAGVATDAIVVGGGVIGLTAPGPPPAGASTRSSSTPPPVGGRRGWPPGCSPRSRRRRSARGRSSPCWSPGRTGGRRSPIGSARRPAWTSATGRRGRSPWRSTPATGPSSTSSSPTSSRSACRSPGCRRPTAASSYPGLAPGIRGGVEVPGDHHVDNRRLLEALLTAGRAAGVTVVRDRVDAVVVGADGGGRRGPAGRAATC